MTHNKPYFNQVGLGLDVNFPLSINMQPAKAQVQRHI